MFTELKFDTIKLVGSLKQQLLVLIDEHLDVFVECDSDVGTTDLVFHEIDTGDSCPLRQSARRVLYGKQRAAIESEI